MVTVGTGTREFRSELSCIQTLAWQLSSTLKQVLFSFDQKRIVEEISHTNSLANSHQLSCNSCSRPRYECLRNLSYKLHLSTFMQLLFSFDQDMRVEKTLIQAVVCQLSLSTNLVPFCPRHASSVASWHKKILIQTLAQWRRNRGGGWGPRTPKIF